MEKFAKWIDFINAMFILLVANLFGVYDKWIVALLVFSVIDYVSGVLSAIYLGKKYKDHGLNSFIGFKGILKKFVLFGVVAIAVLLDDLLNVGGNLRLAIIGFFISNEGISILENAVKMDLPIPDKLIRVLKTLKEDDSKKPYHEPGILETVLDKMEEYDEQA